MLSMQFGYILDYEPKAIVHIEIYKQTEHSDKRWVFYETIFTNQIEYFYFYFWHRNSIRETYKESQLALRFLKIH